MKKKLDKRRFGKDKIFREKRAIDKKKRRKKDEIKNEKEYSLATDQRNAKKGEENSRKGRHSGTKKSINRLKRTESNGYFS